MDISSGTSGATVPASSSEHPDERLVARASLEAAEEKLRSLCASHAPTFVAVERRGAALEGALSVLLGKVEAADPDVGRAEIALDGEGGKDYTHGIGGGSAASSLAALAERHRLRRRTLLQHSSLLELLELPSLMDACVRSNLFDEALSVAGFANTLERRHLMQPHNDEDDGALSGQRVHEGAQPSRRNDVVANVVSEVRRRELDLRRHLLHRLRLDVTMPQCLEAVTALRRLNGVDLERRGHAGGALLDLERVHGAMELRLMVDFLEARDSWLNSGSAAAGGGAVVGGRAIFGKAVGGHGPDGRSEQLLDCIERHRTR